MNKTALFARSKLSAPPTNCSASGSFTTPVIRKLKGFSSESLFEKEISPDFVPAVTASSRTGWVAAGARNTHEWTAEKSGLLKAFDEAGITAVFPRGARNLAPVFAGWFSLNGNGELTGCHWVEESGRCEGPICITNTHSLGTARDATIKWLVERTGGIGQRHHAKQHQPDHNNSEYSAHRLPLRPH